MAQCSHESMKSERSGEKEREKKVEKPALRRELHKDGQMSIVMNAIPAYAASKPHTYTLVRSLHLCHTYTQADTCNTENEKWFRTKYERMEVGAGALAAH